MTSRERLSALIVVLLIFCAGFGVGYWSGQRNEQEVLRCQAEDMYRLWDTSRCVHVDQITGSR